MTKWHFIDLHAFKDYVGFVKLCAPTDFPPRAGVGPEEQWTLELAFEGLRHGMKISTEEKGERPEFATCRALIEEAYEHYRKGQMREGFFKLEAMQKLLKKVPSR